MDCRASETEGIRERRRGRRAEKPFARLSLEERWDALLQNAIEAGLKPKEFWRSTPRELAIAGAAYFARSRREGLFVAWHVAALSRVEDFPSFEELTADAPTPEEIEAEQRRRRAEHEAIMARRNKAAATAAKFNAAVRKANG